MISFAVTAKLICVFVFAYAKSRFSHDAAQMITCVISSIYCKSTFIRGYLFSRFCLRGQFHGDLFSQISKTERILSRSVLLWPIERLTRLASQFKIDLMMNVF